ncbi:MAG TPA: hypothetical protein VFW84_13055 [Aquabacterium sp.]|uniref:hypothetical protein n=1 Tax=Aquabacterium sp. TaxID=1872578 RepID=UPI002E3319CD|nr:hypothetical protein [Aquabacterium sp.]HEX5373651.1 hypothetical protein [Aquabacterium sp.]
MKLKTTLWTTLVASTLAVASLSAHADKREQIQRLPSLQKAELEGLATDMTQQPARQLMGQAQNIMVQAVPPEKREAAAKQINAELTKYVDSATPIVKASASKVAVSAVAPILEDKFTEDELKQLVTMLESPIIKRYQGLLPEMQKSLLEKISADARPQVDPKLNALQESVRKILDTASGGKLSQAAQQQKPAAGAKPAAPAKK